MKKTILYDRHLEQGAKMVEFGGFLMPLEYSSITNEHLAVRKKCGLFDVSHMGQISIRGSDSIAFVNHLITSNVENLSPLKMLYGLMLNEDGGIIDDLMVYKFFDDEILLVINAANIQKDFEWVINQKGDFDVIITDLSAYYSQLALQGPLSEEILQKYTDFNLSKLNSLDFRVIDILDKEFIVSRSGYTGSDGFEIYGSDEAIVLLFDQLIMEDKVTLCGLGSRDTLRFEAGLPLYGHETSSSINPLEAGLKFAIDFSKDFIGSKVLRKIDEEGPKRKLIGLELLERGIARHGYEVYNEDLIGYITTGYMIPGTNKVYAMALVKDLSLKNGDHVKVRIRQKNVLAKVRSKRFLNKNK